MADERQEAAWKAEDQEIQLRISNSLEQIAKELKGIKKALQAIAMIRPDTVRDDETSDE